jgi:hypothetical protein
VAVESQREILAAKRLPTMQPLTREDQDLPQPS